MMRRAAFGIVHSAVLLALAALTVVVSGFSRTVPTTQDPPQRPTFRTEANYVRVDVYPTANGVPVGDLHQDEFDVLEDGTPQKIEQFEHIEIRGNAPQETRHEPTSVAESRAMLENSRARVFVLFLDTYHVEPIYSRTIRKPLVDTLDRLIGADDLVGVMTPDMSALDVTFARRTTTIQGILDRYWWGERDLAVPKDPVEQNYCRCYPPGASDPPGACGRLARELIARRHEKLTLDALEDLVRYLRGVREERKAILAITDGWRLFRPAQSLMPDTSRGVPGMPPLGVDPRTGKLTTKDVTNPYATSQYECDRDRMNLAQLDNAQQFRQLLDEANRANASFYPIDPRGLAVFDSPINDPLPLQVDAALLRGRIDTLRTLAENTDGIAVVNTNDLSGALKRVVADLSSYYLLGYYSTNAKLDGRYHAIKVRVKRPGVQVRARRGYLAATAAEVSALGAKASAPPDAAAVVAAAEARAVEAALGPLAGFSRELPIRMQVIAGWKPGDVGAVWAVGEVPAGEDWKGGGEADVTLTSRAGATISTTHARIEPGSRSFRLALSAPQPLAPGDYAVRVRARGDGAAAIPVNDVVRVALPPAPDVVGAIFVRRGPATGNKEMATADLRFRRSEQLRVEIPAGGSATLSARLLDRSGKLLSVPLTTAVRDDADGSRWQTAQLALAPLAVGDYVIELITGAGKAGGAGEAGRGGGAGMETKRTLVAFRIVP
jgi:VWFA-related protein